MKGVKGEGLVGGIRMLDLGIIVKVWFEDEGIDGVVGFL